ncbi:hypothetical protein HJG60_007754 [Phyllostomus discolor]|uniref:Uncharacterized protein n=1 Tax=Phyllostomus discolor TaxID=89673 RepID=A0A834EVF5_9CHIR|nr:hypothetical protein HJG60_007754 [Phyllostomus discolor]
MELAVPGRECSVRPRVECQGVCGHPPARGLLAFSPLLPRPHSSLVELLSSLNRIELSCVSVLLPTFLRPLGRLSLCGCSFSSVVLTLQLGHHPLGPDGCCLKLSFRPLRHPPPRQQSMPWGISLTVWHCNGHIP